MATASRWKALFNRDRRYRLLLSMTADFLQFAVWFNALSTPIKEDERWFSIAKEAAYRSCLIAWFLAILSEHAIMICRGRPNSWIDLGLLSITLIFGVAGLILSVPVLAYAVSKNGPTILIVATFESGRHFYDSFIDWLWAACLEVIPCEFSLVLRNDLPEGPIQEIDLFIWYKMEMCLMIVEEDDRPTTMIEPYRFPEFSPVCDRSTHSPWLLMKVNNIFIENF